MKYQDADAEYKELLDSIEFPEMGGHIAMSTGAKFWTAKRACKECGEKRRALISCEPMCVGCCYIGKDVLSKLQVVHRRAKPARKVTKEELVMRELLTVPIIWRG